MSKFDDLLTQLGTGKWNFIFFSVCCYCCFIVPFHNLSGPFIVPKLEHSCKTPPLIHHQEDSWKDTNNSTQDSCHYLNNGTKSECTEWDYENQTFTRTLTSEFNWVCSYEYLRATYTSIYMLGNFFGAPINGLLSDRYGRRITTIVGYVVWVIMGIVSSWLPNATSILIVRFIMGFVHPIILQSPYGLGVEVSEPRYRSVTGVLLFLPWPIGVMVVAGLAYFIRDWRYLQMAYSLPGLLLFPLLWYLDESPRWLLVRGHVDKAKKVLQKAARYNGVSLPSDENLDLMLADIQNESMNEKKTPEGSNENLMSGLTALFRTPRLRRIVLLLYIDYFVVSMVYFGLSLNGVNYGVDPFLYMVISGVSELPAHTLAIPLIAKFGRRLPLTWCFLTCAGAIIFLPFIPKNDSTWGLILFMVIVSKMFISIGYQIVFLYTMELLPTEVRLTGLGTTSSVARVGSILCPYITDILGVLYPSLPSLLFGGFSILAGLTNLGLHETLGEPLPDTVEDVENYRKTIKSNGNDKTSELQKLTT